MIKFKEIDENKLYKYFVCSDGFVLRVLKKTYEEHIVKPYFQKNQVIVKVNYQTIGLGQLVAKNFVKGYYNGCCIYYKDNNKMNCRADNLVITSYASHGKMTGGRSRGNPIRITFPNGKIEEFSSVRKAAKSLYCSYQTVLNYMKGIPKNSILKDLTIERLEK